MTLPLDFDLVDRKRYLAGQQRIAERELRDRLRSAARGRRFVPHAAIGRAEHQLPRIAQQLRPALMVFGTGARRGIERFLFGSTSEQAIAAVRTYVLVVKGRYKR